MFFPATRRPPPRTVTGCKPTSTDASRGPDPGLPASTRGFGACFATQRYARADARNSPRHDGPSLAAGPVVAPAMRRSSLRSGCVPPTQTETPSALPTRKALPSGSCPLSGAPTESFISLFRPPPARSSASPARREGRSVREILHARLFPEYGANYFACFVRILMATTSRRCVAPFREVLRRTCLRGRPIEGVRLRAWTVGECGITECARIRAAPVPGGNCSARCATQFSRVVELEPVLVELRRFDSSGEGVGYVLREVETFLHFTRTPGTLRRRSPGPWGRLRPARGGRGARACSLIEAVRRSLIDQARDRVAPLPDWPE